MTWAWFVTSHERMALHEKDNGNLLRVSDVSEKSRSQIYKLEVKLGLGVNNRRATTKFTWFKLEQGNPSGREGYCVVWEPYDASSKDHVENGFTRNSIEATTKGIYLFEKIANGRTKLTAVQQSTLGGNIPIWVMNYMIPQFLGLVVFVQERYKKDGNGKQTSSKARNARRRSSAIGF